MSGGRACAVECCGRSSKGIADRLCATADTVVVACVGGDTVGWLTAQMNEYASLVVCLSTGTPLVWWTWLAGQCATLNEEYSGTLAEAGLTVKSTVSDLVAADAQTAEIGDRLALAVCLLALPGRHGRAP